LFLAVGEVTESHLPGEDQRKEWVSDLNVIGITQKPHAIFHLLRTGPAAALTFRYIWQDETSVLIADGV
jgi:hypothetical protein